MNRQSAQQQYHPPPPTTVQTIYKWDDKNGRQIQNGNNNKDSNQNFVQDIDMYGGSTRNTTYRPQIMQSDAQMTGADPMMNSTAMIQTPSFARKITRSMHQQNLIQLQHGINGADNDFKLELKDEPGF